MNSGSAPLNAEIQPNQPSQTKPTSGAPIIVRSERSSGISAFKSFSVSCQNSAAHLVTLRRFFAARSWPAHRASPLIVI
jgi:hypothetical protein